MLPQILQADTIRQCLRHEVARRLREENLPAMSSTHDASRMMHV